MFKGKFEFNADVLSNLLKPKSPPLIGVDISSSSVKMVELASSGKGRYRLERYTIEPLPRDAVDTPLICCPTARHGPHDRALATPQAHRYSRSIQQTE